MTVPIDSDTYAALGRVQRQHDLYLTHAYRSGLHNRANLDAIARDPETLYHIEATEAICDYLEAHDNA